MSVAMIFGIAAVFALALVVFVIRAALSRSDRRTDKSRLATSGAGTSDGDGTKWGDNCDVAGSDCGGGD